MLTSLAVYQGYSIPPAYGIVNDISEMGIRIETDRILAKGQNLQVRIQFNDTRGLFEAGARVKWTRPTPLFSDSHRGALSGIELDCVSPPEVTRLRKLIVSPEFASPATGSEQFDDFLEALRPFLVRLGKAIAELSRRPTSIPGRRD